MASLDEQPWDMLQQKQKKQQALQHRGLMDRQPVSQHCILRSAVQCREEKSTEQQGRVQM